MTKNSVVVHFALLVLLENRVTRYVVGENITVGTVPMRLGLELGE